MTEPSNTDEALARSTTSAASIDARRASAIAPGGVRSTDLEPYTGLRYLSTLFRIMAVILLVVLVAEAVAGLAAQGTSSFPTVIGEASRLIVLAGVLWGTGDLATLLVDIGHDVRATRILLHRQVGQPGADASSASSAINATNAINASVAADVAAHADPSMAPAPSTDEPYSTIVRASER